MLVDTVVEKANRPHVVEPFGFTLPLVHHHERFLEDHRHTRSTNRSAASSSPCWPALSVHRRRAHLLFNFLTWSQSTPVPPPPATRMFRTRNSFASI